MKRVTILLTFLGAFLSEICAQIPNYGFENWTNFGGYEDPNDWATMNSSCTGPFYSVTKSSDHYPEGIGSFALRLENNTSLTQETGGWGVIVTKSFDYPFKPAFPVIGHPTSLCGYVKFLPQNGDEAGITVVLFKDGVMIGNNSTTITSTEELWQPFTIEFETYEDADSATIMVMAWTPSAPTDPPQGNSVIYIDNLSFNSLINSVPDKTLSNCNVRIYPNPASDYITVSTENINNTDIIVNIYNVIGALVKSKTLLQDQEQLNIGDLGSGIYMLEIKSKEWSEKQKLIIKR
ncbi:MAG: T9SS type A sorting domain-containing protein [Bacteroidales bacterium]|nr:T9SS type A sorting domain-containing protein [Bacteroidales bacterium]